jgi:hypothetical protein
MRRHAVSLAVLAAFTLGAPSADAQAPATQRVRGTIERVDEGGIRVRSREGEDLSIALTPDARVSTLKRVELGSVAPGSYVGTAALPQADGSLRAIEVLIFPETMRGTGEGHRAWDLLPESTMTNATVADTVAAVDGRVLTLSYGGERKRVVVPPDAPVVTPVPATRADLKAGEAVFLSAQRQPDGSLRAAQVTVGKDGVAPPM